MARSGCQGPNLLFGPPRFARQIFDVRLRPGGKLIGTPGRGRRVRELPGGMAEAEEFFEWFCRWGRNVPSGTYPGKLVEFPGLGRVGLRPSSKSGPPTIDVAVRIEGLRGLKIKFVGYRDAD